MEPSSESSRKFMDMISTLCAEVDNKQKLPEKKPQRNASGKCMKPAYAFSAIIALALKNSPDGRLPVWKIYAFILEHFRYFRTANEAWRNSVRHSLSKNGNFEKCLKEDGSKMKDGNMWQIIESRREAIDREILKYRLSDKYHAMNLAALNKPEILTSLEEGSFGLPPFVFEKEYKQAYRILANQKNKRPEIPKNFEVASNVFKESNMNTLNTDLDTLARPNPISVLLNENTPSPISRIDLLKPSIPSSSSQNMSEASMNAEEKQIYEKYLTSDSNPLLSSAALPGAVVPEIDDCMLWECEQDTLEAGIQTRLRHDENDFWLPTRSNCIFDLPSDNLSVVSDGF